MIIIDPKWPDATRLEMIRFYIAKYEESQTAVNALNLIETVKRLSTLHPDELNKQVVLMVQQYPDEFRLGRNFEA